MYTCKQNELLVAQIEEMNARIRQLTAAQQVRSEAELRLSEQEHQQALSEANMEALIVKRSEEEVDVEIEDLTQKQEQLNDENAKDGVQAGADN